MAKTEDNPTWVRSTIKRLENHFDKSAVNQIRMHCQCGYGMDEKLALVKELAELSSNIVLFHQECFICLRSLLSNYIMFKSSLIAINEEYCINEKRQLR